MANSDGCAGYILCPECDAGYPVEDYAKGELNGKIICEDCGTKFEWYAIYHYYSNFINDKSKLYIHNGNG